MTRPAAIDPAAWLASHDPAAGLANSLDVGAVELAAHQGNVWIALAAEPALRIELMLSWLLSEAEASGCARVAAKVRQLGQHIDAVEGV